MGFEAFRAKWCMCEAFKVYKKALFMVEFDEDFEEHSDEEVELPPMKDVHAERLRCGLPLLKFMSGSIINY